jgi:hypothetical protein
MKIAISVLKQELAYVKANRDKCPHSDDYFEGWVESLKASIYILSLTKEVNKSCQSRD